MRKLTLLAAVGCLILLFATAGQAALFTNGSFENGSYDAGLNNYNTLFSGSTAVDGWVVGGGGIDWINAYWTPADGTKSIDLAGNNPGSISQTFDTTVGTLYTVEFAMSGNPDGLPILKALIADAFSPTLAGATIEYFNTTGVTRIGGMDWSTRSFQFLANSPSTTLTFASFSSTTPYGAALDNVKVTAVPEAGAMILFASGLVGLIGYRRTRRMQ